MSDRNHTPESRLNESDLTRLERLLRREAGNAWAIGDELIRLCRIGWRVKNLAQRFNRKPNRLSEYRQLSTNVPAERRDYSVPFTHYSIARRVQAKKLAPDLSLDEIRRVVSSERTGDGRTLGQPRDALRFFGQRRAERENRENVQAAALALLASEGSDLIGRCHHSAYQSVLERIGDGSVKILHLDPPYANYKKFNDGKLDHSTAAARIACDNADGEAALRVTLDALPLASRKLAPGGTALLWQSTVGPVRLPILHAIEDCGLVIEREVWWDKRIPQLEDGDACYSTQAERLYVLRRGGEKLVNHDPSLHRGNVLTFMRVQMRAEAAHEHHFFEKPAELNEYLIRKHSYEGDLIFDAFGCSGGFCVAAERLGRRWVYCESNAENFTFGSQKIAGALLERRAG
jgi:DNA modification methylase